MCTKCFYCVIDINVFVNNCILDKGIFEILILLCIFNNFSKSKTTSFELYLLQQKQIDNTLLTFFFILRDSLIYINDIYIFS